jgi:hypothetical protein
MKRWSLGNPKVIDHQSAQAQVDPSDFDLTVHAMSQFFGGQGPEFGLRDQVKSQKQDDKKGDERINKEVKE